jgi:hypothetical protein
MWDFSWLERRWPGAGYEDWDRALDELAERGYDAVRIDAYPHLIYADPAREWTLLPHWTQHDWGAPARVRVQIWPALPEFIRKCAARSIRVALSSWYRQDADNTRMLHVSPRHHAEGWIATLRLLDREGLLGHLLFVDLCNEWPCPAWAPYYRVAATGDDAEWDTPGAITWMREAIGYVRAQFPELAYTFSTSTAPAGYDKVPLLDFCDLLEPHVWMALSSDFYTRVGWDFPRDRFSTQGYENVVLRGEAIYRADPEKYQEALRVAIEEHAGYSRRHGLPLVTTECWGIVCYKDWPLLDWGWVKETCALGTEWAAATGRWNGIATSNFCGPQFRGMWRDVAWHQRLTRVIRQAPVDEALRLNSHP